MTTTDFDEIDSAPQRMLLVWDAPNLDMGRWLLTRTAELAESGGPALEPEATVGVGVTVLGFREHAGWALASDSLEFVDLEDTPHVFSEPLPRIGLDSLPERGAWLQPFRPLSSLLTARL